MVQVVEVVEVVQVVEVVVVTWPNGIKLAATEQSNMEMST